MKFSDKVADFNQYISLTNELPTTLPNLINKLIPYLMTFSGLILFIMLLTGGFQMLMAGADPKQADAGKQRLTTALVGFLIIVIAYWVTQIVQIVLGVTILN